jgi:hypothetical protein
MRKNVLLFLFLTIAGTQLFFSCASSQAVAVSHSRGSVEPKKPTAISHAPPAEDAPPIGNGAVIERRVSVGRASGASPERPAVAVPERAENPLVSRTLLGQGQIEAEKLAAFLLTTNSRADPEFVTQLARFYVEESALEGVDHDVAFAQMCLETGFLRYGGLVTPDMNNFCGLGATGPGNPGERFATPQLGVRAQIQHLKGYATEDPLSQELVDPRYKYVRYGAAPTLEGLAGTWATDHSYAEKIASILERISAANVAIGQPNP